MKVAILGGTGMIGTALARALRARGDVVTIISRRDPAPPDYIPWESRGITQVRRLEGHDVFVNLAGAPLADRPWTTLRRRQLWSSRVEATQFAVAALKELRSPPPVYIGAGLLWRFGHRGDEWIDDDDPAGSGFLEDLSVAWEAEHLAAAEAGCRAAVLRMGIVLSPSGGAFPAMLMPFRVGIGGWLGNGQQFTPMITLRDAVSALIHLIEAPGARGAFNANPPDPLRHYEWMMALGRSVGKPVVTHAPMWALRGALGELADHLLIASCRARPRKLTESGFKFQDTDVDAAFRSLIDQVPTR